MPANLHPESHAYWWRVPICLFRSPTEAQSASTTSQREPLPAGIRFSCASSKPTYRLGRNCWIDSWKSLLVRRAGSHSMATSARPEVVEQFSSDAFRAALQLTVRKWNPAIAQLEFTQMAQYAADCAPARPILVEHDITFDLYQQLTKTSSDWDLQRELKRWRRFETAAWREMACVVTMSAKDQSLIAGTRSVALPNGVDLDRFRVASREPDPKAPAICRIFFAPAKHNGGCILPRKSLAPPARARTRCTPAYHCRREP